jgi:hypothetical protein
MARTKNPTRPPGKPKGAKDKVPGARKVKASVKSILKDIVENQHATIRSCIMAGLKASPRDAHHYLKLAAEYVDGKPDANLRIQFDEDELATARQSLHKKLDALMERITQVVETPQHET